MKPYRDEIESLEQNGITKVAFSNAWKIQR